MGTGFVCCEIVWLWRVSNSIGCVPRAKRLDGVSLVDWHFASVFSVFALNREFQKLWSGRLLKCWHRRKTSGNLRGLCIFQELVRFCVCNFDGLQHWAMEAFCPWCRHWIKYLVDELAHSNIDLFWKHCADTEELCWARRKLVEKDRIFLQELPPFYDDLHLCTSCRLQCGMQ